MRGKPPKKFSGKYKHPFGSEWKRFKNNTYDEISILINRSPATISMYRQNHKLDNQLVFPGRAATEKREAVSPVIVEFFK